MKMNKKAAGILLAAMSTMIFTGCGSSDNQSKGGVDKKVQIEYWHVAPKASAVQRLKNWLPILMPSIPISRLSKNITLICIKG